MRLSPALAVIVLGVALAGCVSDPARPGDGGSLLTVTPVDVFDDPRTSPHPQFGWPTATRPYTEGNTLVNPWLQPIEPAGLPETISRIEPLAHPAEAEVGAGIAVFGQLAIIPGHGTDTAVYDISDPTRPRLLSQLPMADNVTARDVDVIIHPDGRITAVFATNEGRNPVWDLTDPSQPELLADILPDEGSHNVAIVPGTPILYNANSAGGNANGLVGTEALAPETAVGVTEIYDLSDPSDPRLVTVWENGYGCHDITFHLDADKERYRAYCAGIEMTQIWDIADPLAPEVLVNIPVHHGAAESVSASVPLVLFSHLAMVSHDADVLIVGDETGGGLAPGCDAYIDAQAQTASGPLGNLYFYDISDETAPVLRSWLSPDSHFVVNPPQAPPAGTIDPSDPIGTAFNVAAANPGCTAHFGRNIEDHDMLTIAFYGAGVLLIDYSDVAHPVIVDQWVEPGQNTWDVWYYQGYLFTGDMARGFEVLSLA